MYLRLAYDTVGRDAEPECDTFATTDIVTERTKNGDAHGWRGYTVDTLQFGQVNIQSLSVYCHAIRGLIRRCRLAMPHIGKAEPLCLRFRCGSMGF